jgi:hypothetical protein
MAILNIQINQVGTVGFLPRIVYINTDDTDGTILTTGYLNQAVQQGYAFSEYDMCCVATRATPSSSDIDVGWYGIDHVGNDWSLVVSSSPGDVVLPTITNRIATYANTTGTLTDDASTAINGGNIQAGLSGTAGYFASFPGTAARGSLRLTAVANTGNTLTTISNAAMGQASVISIPDPGQTTSEFIIADSAGTQHITSGALQVDAGAISSGLSAGGFVGLMKAFPTTASSGFIAMQGAVNASGDFGTTISNATTQAQAQVVTIPNAGAATANFLLDTGAANILAMQQFVGISNVLTFGTGTWTVTRIAQGNYVSRHTAGDETSIIAVDITPQIRIAASKGFRLDSFDYIYSIGTLAMDAHSVTLDRIAYANNVAVSVTSIPITGTLATATQANPYLTNVTIDTPAFDITADSKYVIEITANNSATSAYDFYGIMLHFSQTIA